MINFKWYQFKELSPHQLYDILRARSMVFVVEQQCPYLDPDNADKSALHLIGEDDGELVAYIRLFAPIIHKDYVLFGRVLTVESARGKGYGKKLLQELMDYCHIHFPNIPIKCSAQLYLKHFYEAFGFVAHGNVYDEDGIAHITMIYEG